MNFLEVYKMCTFLGPEIEVPGLEVPEYYVIIGVELILTKPLYTIEVPIFLVVTHANINLLLFYYSYFTN